MKAANKTIIIGDNSPGLGDHLLLTAVAREVKRLYQDYKIEIQVSSYAELFYNNTNIDYINLTTNPFITPNIGSGHWVQRKCRHYSVIPQKCVPDIFLTKEEIYFAEEFIKKNKLQNFITLSIDCSKKWKHLRYIQPNFWEEVLDPIKKNISILQFGLSNNFTQLKNGLTFELPDLTVRQVAAIQSFAISHIGIDTGDMHTAIAVNTQTISLVPRSCEDYNWKEWHYDSNTIQYLEFGTSATIVRNKLLETINMAPTKIKTKTNKTAKFTTIEKSKKMKIHFFTIVLNGMPFLKWHINVFKQLKCEWHWHIVEGVADFAQDTIWCKNNGGEITDKIHTSGLSMDGTTQYLDNIQKLNSNNVTIYRNRKNKFWNGKLEMVQAPLKNINCDCLLWQVDADELWTPDQIEQVNKIFTFNNYTAAYFYCHFFVGDRIAISSINTYGNNTDYEWLRVWRYKPGYKWISHEPPILGFEHNGAAINIGHINPIKHDKTKSLGLIFQHYAYATKEQVLFKENYYGYKNGVNSWIKLNKTKTFPVNLREYFPWVTDESTVDTIDKLNIDPLAYITPNGNWSFKERTSNNILFIRTDSIGDNILASSMLKHIKKLWHNFNIYVLCQSHIAELYEECPYVFEIIKFNKKDISTSIDKLNELIIKLNQFNFSVILNSIYSREFLSDYISTSAKSITSIAHLGDCSNTSINSKNEFSKLYTKIIPNNFRHHTELDRHKDYLNGLNIDIDKLEIDSWISKKDLDFADNFFFHNKINPKKTIILYAGAQTHQRLFLHYGKALNEICSKYEYSVVALGSNSDYDINQINLNDIKTKHINLCGKVTLRQSAAILHKSLISIGAETGLAHLSCAVGTKNIIILGGGHFGRFMPYSSLTSIVCLPMPCFECNWICIHDKPYCIKNIDYEVLTQATNDSLQHSSDKSRIYLQFHNSFFHFNNDFKIRNIFKKFDINSIELIPFSKHTP